MKDTLKNLIIRIDERCIAMQSDITEIKDNGVQTKERVSTLETTAVKHRTYFKGTIWFLSVLTAAVIGGIIRIVSTFF